MLRACYRHAANALTVHPRVQMLILTSALLQTGTNLVADVFTCKQMSGTNQEMEEQEAFQMLTVRKEEDLALCYAKVQLLVSSLFSRTRTRSCIRHCLTRFISGCAKLCSQEAHCLEGRSVHRDQGSRDRQAQEEGC